MKTTHGKYSDEVETHYQIEATGKFHSSMKSIYLKGWNFRIRISGPELENINLWFQHGETQCRHEVILFISYNGDNLRKSFSIIDDNRLTVVD